MFDMPNDTTRLTVELREIIESGVDIWDFEYDCLYTGKDKLTLEQKIIDHYYFRQIGQETVGRWLHMFRTRMREIMPYYKQLLGTVKIMEELPSPFDNVDVVETMEQTTTTTGINKFSDTPQGDIENLDNYLTNASKEDGSTTTTNTYTKKGNQGVNTYAHDMLEFRETLLSIDTMIINELGDLFIQVY